MNTTEKGNNFEDIVFNLMKNELSLGNLLVNPKYSKIFKKKAYYSKDRESSIIVDIAIEVYLPNKDTWSLLMVVECKDYSSTIEASELEEFKSKLDQIAGKNVKGIFISTIEFQKGAYNFARNNGIALVKILKKEKVEWILTRRESGKITAEKLNKSSKEYEELFLTNRGGNFNIICCLKNFNTLIFSELIKTIIFNIELSSDEENNFEKIFNVGDSIKKTNIYNISNKTIEQFAEKLLDKSGCISIINTFFKINYEMLFNYLFDKFGLYFNFDFDLGYSIDGFQILGKYNKELNTIYISNSLLKTEPRWNFTLLHEIGHITLSHTLLIENDIYGDYEESIILFNFSNDLLSKMDRQANFFAASFLMPKQKFIYSFYDVVQQLKIMNKNHGPLYLDNQKCNLENYFSVTSYLKARYNVSRKAVEFRLKYLNLINDNRRGYR